VAVGAIRAVEAAGRGNATVSLGDGTTLVCGRAWREGLQRALGA
jgi:hypothetical protein